MMRLTPENERRFLLLESCCGHGKLVSEKTLDSIIKKKMATLNVVFVAACQSEFVGSIFHKCGAKHVICVKQNKHVLDDAAIHFTKSFYRSLFNQGEVCVAFEEAKFDVGTKYKKHEADLFKLMK